MQILDYAIVPDGGTQVFDLELDDGMVLSIGLDGRMDAPLGGKQLFIGQSPNSPDARLLAVGGSDEADIIRLLEQWLDQAQAAGRKETLLAADTASLADQDLRDRMVIEFLLQVKARDLESPET